MGIHPDTRMGPVHYTVRNLSRLVDFYRDVLGFHLIRRQGGEAVLGTQARQLLRMTEAPDAPRPRGTTGLYHTAFLMPTRWDLAHLVQRIIDTRTPVQGTSNHGTHLAIYLSDPEGNGIELAWDFPREQWPLRNGRMVPELMPRRGVDIDQLLTELERDPSPWPGLPPEATVGHVHLHVSDLDSSRRFYCDILGFDVTMEGWGMGALFVSAGGYHHHIGMNVWKGVGIPAPPEGAAGLRYFTVVVPDEAELEKVVSRVKEAGLEPLPHPDGVRLRDPSGNHLVLTTAT